MKPLKSKINKVKLWTVTLLFTFGLNALKADKHPLSGKWKWKEKNTNGELVTGFTWFYEDEEVGINRITSVTVDATTREPIEAWNVYQLPTTNGIGSRLWTGSNGSIGIGTELINDSSSVVTFSGYSTNGVVSGTIESSWNKTKETMKSHAENVVVGAQFFKRLNDSSSGKKIDYDPEENEEIKVNRDKLPIVDDRFADLIGKWQSTNEQGERNLEIEFLKWDLGNSFLEKWTFYDSGQKVTAAGFNITKKDPLTGVLKIWAIDKYGFTESGGWDFIDPFTLGQRQGEARLVRRFLTRDKIQARWQSKLDGEFKFNGNGYILKRVKSDDVQFNKVGESSQNRSYFDRATEATKFNGFVKIDYKIVAENDIPKYLEAESKWKQLHEQRMVKGALLHWHLAKVTSAENGSANFATVQVYPSFESMQNPDVWESLDYTAVGSQEELWQKTKGLFTDAGSDTYQAIDQFWSPYLKNYEVDVINSGYMNVNSEMDKVYLDAESSIAKPFWAFISSIDSSFGGWTFHKLLNSTRPEVKHDYLTSQFKYKDFIPTQEDWNKNIQIGIKTLNGQMVNWDSIRKMNKGPNYEIVLRADANLNPTQAEWQKLIGNWKCENEDGSYRIKRISRNTEQLEIYDADNNLVVKGTFPMKIEVKDGFQHFYTYHPSGTYHSIYKIHKNKWYEQMRGIMTDNYGEPNKFLVYNKL